MPVFPPNLPQLCQAKTTCRVGSREGIRTQHPLPSQAQSASPSQGPTLKGREAGREGWSVDCLHLKSKEFIPYATGSLGSQKHFSVVSEWNSLSLPAALQA